MIYLLRKRADDDVPNRWSIQIGQIVNGQGVYATLEVDTPNIEAWFDDPANLTTLQAAIAGGTVDDRVKDRIRYFQFRDRAETMDNGLQTIINAQNPTNAQVIAAVKQLADYQQQQLRAIIYVARRINALANDPD